MALLRTTLLHLVTGHSLHGRYRALSPRFLHAMPRKRVAEEAADVTEVPKGKRKKAKAAAEPLQVTNGASNATKAPPNKRGRLKAAVEANQAEPEHAGPRHYFLKSEPDEFSIEDLAAAKDSTEPWDGVRNAQARNIMKGMRVGDQCFFYHSNCRQPGIVGIAEVVREAYPDHTAADASNAKYDAKHTAESPKWVMVDVRLVRKLARLVSLVELKQPAEAALQGMALFKYGRLSVQRVEPAHQHFVLGLEHQEA